jgi:catechol 2,3-dioxygenase-like lactoylglutathione lyase family enzyme
MARTTGGLLLLLVALPALGASDAAEDPARRAHGTFTGEIKAVLYVSDVEASTPFYRDSLGFEFHGYAPSSGEPYYAEMAAAGVKFGLHEPMSKAEQAKVGQQRLYFRVKDLSAQRSRALAWGAEPSEVKKTAWMDMFVVRDPDGNEVFFAVTDPERHTIDPWNSESSANKRAP